MKKQRISLAAIILLLIASFSAYAQIKVACIGNSITYGYGLSSPSTQSYPTKLQALLGNGYAVGNYGVSARTMLKNGDRPYWNESAYTNAKASNPDIVIIMLGTNDAKLQTNWTPHKAEFPDDYKAMITAFRSLSSKPEVWVCKIVPAYKEIWEISNTTIVNEVNPAITEVSVVRGTHLIDMYTEMDNSSTLFQSDGIHPTADGAIKMANFIYGCLMSDTLSVTKTDSALIAPEGYAYQWYMNGVAIEGGNQQKFTPTEDAIYKVAVQIREDEATRIMSDTASFKVMLPDNTGVSENELSVVAYPNPCDEVLAFDLSGFSSSNSTISLFSVDGGLILSKAVASGAKTVELDVSHLSSGVYFYTLKDASDQLLKGKVSVK